VKNQLGRKKETAEQIALSLAPRTVAEIAYLAGFVDADGCIAVYEYVVRRTGWHQVSFMLHAANTDLRPLNWIRERFGGAITRRGGVRVVTHRENYCWYAMNARAAAIMQLIRPHMRVKGEQVDLALRFRETYGCSRDPVTGRNNAVPTHVRERRVVLLAEIKALKRRAS